MIYGTYLSASGISQARARQDVLANNLANVETSGFRRMLTLQAERSPQPDGPRHLRHMTGGNVLLPTRIDTTAGALEETGNPLDVALVGDGFLAVERRTPTGPQRLLSRDGRLTLDHAGNLTLSGRPDVRVLDVTGRPIRIDADTARAGLTIGENGDIRTLTGTEPLGRLRLSGPVDPGMLSAAGGNLFAPNGPTRSAPDTFVRGGFVESSNVDPTHELTRLMEAGRSLEMNANMIRFQDTSLGRLIEASAVA